MRFSSLVVPVLVSSAIAAPFQQHSLYSSKFPQLSTGGDKDRDGGNQLFGNISGGFKNLGSGTGSAVREAIRGLDKSVVALGEQIEKFDGDSFAALDLMNAAEAIVTEIQKGINITEQGEPISFADGVLILPLFASFIPHTRKTMSLLASKKEVFAKAEVVSVVLDKLNKIKDAGKQFDNTVVQKLDFISKPFGVAIYFPIDKALKKGIEELGAVAGAGAGAGGSVAGADDAALAAAIAAADGA